VSFQFRISECAENLNNMIALHIVTISHKWKSVMHYECGNWWLEDCYWWD